MLTVGSLFAGIGGFDLGFERAGFQTRWRCEIEPFCQKVLINKLPSAEIYTDVRGIGKTVLLLQLAEANNGLYFSADDRELRGVDLYDIVKALAEAVQFIDNNSRR